MVQAIDRCLRAFRRLSWPSLAPVPPLVNVHRLDTDNVGDRLASPAPYFDFLAAAAPYDLLRVPGRVWRGARMIVFGGGGLLDNDYFRPGWTDVLRATSAEAIAWGVGHNRHGAGRRRYPDFLQSFALVGVRDSGPDVPGSSGCRAPAACTPSSIVPPR